MKRATRVLFNWRPRVLSPSLGDRFQRRMAAAGFTGLNLIEVRDPEYNTRNTPTYWHKDAEPYPNQKLIVWSNIRPTEIKFANGDLLQTQDGDVILIDNDEVMHKAPNDQSDRWFIRSVVLEADSRVTPLGYLVNSTRRHSPVTPARVHLRESRGPRVP